MTRRSLPVFLLIMLCALALRLGVALRYDPVPDYADIAKYEAAALEPGIPRSLPPGYPLFLRAVYSTFGPNAFRAVFIIQALIGSLSICLMYRITERIGGRRPALVAAAIAALYPSFVLYTAAKLTETLAIFVLLLILEILTAPMSEGRRSAFAAIAVIAGAAVKPAMLLFAPGMLPCLRKRVVFLAVLAGLALPLAFGGVLFPYSIQKASLAFYRMYNPASSGRFYADAKKTGLRSDTLASETYLRSAADFVAANRWKAVDLTYGKAAINFSRGWDAYFLAPIAGQGRNVDHVLSYAFIPVLLLALAGLARRYTPRARPLLLLMLSYVLLMTILLIYKIRYRLPAEPALIVFAALFAAGARPKVPEEPPAAGERDSSWKTRPILALCLGAGAAARLYAVFSHRSLFGADAGNAWNRFVAARLDAGAAPLYPLYLRGCRALFGAGGETAALVVQAIAGSLTALLLYQTVSRLWNRRAGLVAAALAALYPPFILYCAAIDTATFAALLFAAVMALVLSRLRPAAKAAASAALAAAATLLAPFLVCLVPGLALSLERRRLFLLLTLLLLLPYPAINLLGGERLEPVYRPASFELGLRAYTHARDGWDAVDKIYGNASVVLGRGWSERELAAAGGARTHAAHISAYAYVLAAAIGTFGLLRHGRSGHLRAVMPVLVFLSLMILFSVVRRGHRVGGEPLLLAYCSIVLARFGSKGHETGPIPPY